MIDKSFFFNKCLFHVYSCVGITICERQDKGQSSDALGLSGHVPEPGKHREKVGLQQTEHRPEGQSH